MTQKAKNWMSVLAVLIIIYGIAANQLRLWPFDAALRRSQESRIMNQENEICIQVITPAQNPETGEVVEFPTPCDVPDGWEKIEPEETENVE